MTHWNEKNIVLISGCSIFMRWIWVNYFQRTNRQEKSLTIWPISSNVTNPSRKNYCDAKLKTNSLWHFSNLKHLDRFFPHLTITHLQPVLCGDKNNPVLLSRTSRFSSWTRSFNPCSPDRQELRKSWLSTELLLNQTCLESCLSKEKNWSELFFSSLTLQDFSSSVTRQYT